MNQAGNPVQESFTCDNLDRLLTYTVGQRVDSVRYDISGYGNIISKTDVGSYDYTGQVHRVSSIMQPGDLMQGLPNQSITYTRFNKVNCITDTLASGEIRNLDFVYGPDQQRVKTIYKNGETTVKTKYFALGQLEREVDSLGNVRDLYYISGSDGVVAVLERKNSQDTIYYIHTDYLGSFDVITKSDGTVKERYNFDPCSVRRSFAKAEGRRRNPADWSYDNVPDEFFIDRGFTGHEHLDQFGLINMNGRVYDPVIAMFLSPDKFVQSPDFTQDFNRYTYALNNPLTYTDLSGNYVAASLGMQSLPKYNFGGSGGFGDIASGRAFYMGIQLPGGNWECTVLGLQVNI